MNTYYVFYKNCLIGILYTNDKQHKYTSIDNEFSDEILMPTKESQDWGSKIPFFESRLINAFSHDVTDNISYHGDNYRLELQKEL